METMIMTKKIEIEGIPSLKVERHDLKDQPLPIVLFWHGWTSVKERNLYYAYLLAEEGLRVIMPEAMGHGERKEELSEHERQVAFFPIVMKSIRESADIRKYCQEQGWVKEDRFAMAGTSMGAIITLGSLATYDWVKAAVSLMGTPYLVGFAKGMINAYLKAGVALPYSEEQIQQMIEALEPFDLGKNPEKLKNRPLLFWHGKKDPMVPYDQSRLFYDNHSHEPQMIMDYVSDEKAEHVVTQEGAIALKNWLVEHAK
jgi:uncharacterized protein